jgi:hypothetical protein
VVEVLVVRVLLIPTLGVLSLTELVVVVQTIAAAVQTALPIAVTVDGELRVFLAQQAMVVQDSLLCVCFLLTVQHLAAA